MATDLERLVVSLDADITRLTKQLAKAGVVLDAAGKNLDNKSRAIGKKVGDNIVHGASASSGLGYVQGQEFLHIGKSLVDQVVAGQSPLRALTVEGGRIAQAFGAGSGGVVGTFKALGTTLVGMASPAALVAAGVLAIGAAAVFAVSSFEEATTSIRLGLSGIGAGSNASIDDVRRLGAEIAKTQGISSSAGQDIALGLAKTGSIDKSSIAGAGGLTRGYANLTGTDIPTAGAALADIFSDPASGADKLNKVLGTLDAKTRDYIRSLQAQGQQQAAVRALIDAVTPGITRAAEQTGFWAGAWDRVTRAASNAGEAVRTVVAPTAFEQLNRLNGQLAAVQRSAGAGEDPRFGVGLGRKNLTDRLKAEIATLQGQVSAAEEDRAGRATAVSIAKQSDAGTEVVTSSNPAAQQIQTMQEQVAKLDQALNTPGVADRIVGGGDKARATLDDLKARLADLQKQYASGGEVAASALREADYKSKTAELDGYAKAVADARHETERLVEATRDSGDAANAAAAKRSAEQAGAANIAAIRKDYESKPSSYAKSITDAPSQYRDPIYAAAEKYGLDPNYLTSILSQESGRFRPDVISGRTRSPAGAIGIAQFMPGTAAQYGVDPTDAAQSIEGAAHYLADLKKQFGGNLTLATAAYNAGPGRVASATAPGGAGLASLKKETRDYIPAVLNPSDPAKQLDFAKSLDREYADQKASVDALSQSTDKHSAAVLRAQTVQRLYDQALAAGLPAGDETRKLVEARADSFLKLDEAQRRAQGSASIRQAYAELGRTSDQQDVYERASQLATPGTADFQGYADELTKIQAWTETKADIAEPFHGLTAALIEGKSAADALKSSVTSLVEKFADKAEDSLISGLFSGFGGGATGGGGLFSGIGKLFGFADGGRIQGAGTGTSDSILARVSSGEYIVNAAAAKKTLPLLDAINSGRFRRFATGGLVSMAAIPAAVMPAAAGASLRVNAPFTVDARGAMAGVPDQIQGAIGAYHANLQRNIVGILDQAQRRRFR